MANVEFPEYMKGVSGTLKTIKYNDGTKRKVIVTCSKSGKQRMYIRDYKPRTAKVTENEKRIAGSKPALTNEGVYFLGDNGKLYHWGKI